MAHAVPSHAQWFDPQQTHTIERDALPDFFDESHPTKNEKTYRTARNHLVRAYRAAPQTHLSFTEARRCLALDVASVYRMHQFLEHWGLINYQPTAAATNVLRGVPNGGVVVDAPTPVTTTAAMLGHARATSKPRQLAVREAIYPGSGEAWSDSETLTLLEALEKYEDRWEDVASYVGKSVEACILHFVQLPIEEQYRHEALVGTAPASSSASSADPMARQLATLAAASAPASGEAASAAGEAAKAMREASTALLAAVQQKALAKLQEEERTMRDLLVTAVAAQMERLNAKLEHFDKANELLQKERVQTEQARHHLFGARMAVEKRRLSGSADPPVSNSVPVVKS